MTKKPPPDDDEWETAFAAETTGLGGMIVRDGVGHPVSQSEALQWAIDYAQDDASVAEAVDACLFGLTVSIVDVRITALRGIATLSRREGGLPRRDALERAIQAALEDGDAGVRAAALEAQRARGKS